MSKLYECFKEIEELNEKLRIEYEEYLLNSRIKLINNNIKNDNSI